MPMIALIASAMFGPPSPDVIVILQSNAFARRSKGRLQANLGVNTCTVGFSSLNHGDTRL